VFISFVILVELKVCYVKYAFVAA